MITHTHNIHAALEGDDDWFNLVIPVELLACNFQLRSYDGFNSHLQNFIIDHIMYGESSSSHAQLA